MSQQVGLRLAHLARTDLAHDGFQDEVDGPYPFGGGWALQHESTATLLIAGGTGVTGWLPILNAIRSNHRATSKEYCYANMKCHLVWCVHDEADYRALAKRLPPLVAVTVFVTQSADVAMPTSSDIRIDAENAYDGVEGAQTTVTTHYRVTASPST
ncbi:ferric reductase [Pseudoscourfieldia marina]